MKNVEQASDAASKVVDLLTKSADQIGHTAVSAFPYLVRLEWAQALVGVSAGVLALSVSAFAAYRWLKWHKTGFKREDETIGCVAAGAALVTLFFGSLFITTNLASLIEPTGATINYLLKLAAH